MRWLATFALLSSTLVGAESGRAAEVTVSAAVSLKAVLTEAVASYERTSEDRIVLNLGASGALAAQILSGAPADLMIAAGAEPMDRLITAGRIVPASRRDFAKNGLALVAATHASRVEGFADLADAAVGHVAIGEPKIVPVGAYATEVLDRLGLSTRLASKLVYGNNARQVLAYVEAGNVDAALVYASDARSSKKVRLVAVADPAWHAPIAYPFAVVSGAEKKEAVRRFARFLAGDDVARLIVKHGLLAP